jgi:predicted small metal-binding protein
MKKMTCAEMGGPCQAEISGNTLEELAANGTAHVAENHPEMAEQMKAHSDEDKAKWMADMQAKWDAAAEM